MKYLNNNKRFVMFQIQDKYQIQYENEDGTFMRGVSKKDGKVLAIKKICFASMTEKDKKCVTQQVNLLRSVKSNNIVRYYDYIIDKAQANLYVIMEFCSGGSLEDFLALNRQNKTFIQEKIIWKIFTQVVSAVNQIHSDPQGAILHRDIKPKNILLDKDNNVKLGNFSLLRRLDPQEEFALTYTSGSYYKSPQQIVSGIFSTQSDIWALGCLLFEMAALKSPFKKNSDLMTAKSIREDKVQKINPIYSQQLRRVICWCLQKQRQNRPTAQMLKSIPQINYRIRKSRLAQYKKSIEQKEQRVGKKQIIVENLQKRIKQLEQILSLSLDSNTNSMSSSNKENYDYNNTIKSVGFQTYIG